MDKPIFNIIFLPHTVKFQAIPLISLLLNTSFTFRLIGNGLSKKESELLKKISSCTPRLHFFDVESTHILPHGTVLDLMFIHEQNDLFCFMDPDIFAFDKFDVTAESLLKTQDVFSSCSRMENDQNSIYSGFKGGATTISPDGKIPLASSFFCIYKRNSLQKAIYEYNIGFEQYRSAEQIPPKVIDIINKLGLTFEMFDTGKLLSVILDYMGFTKTYETINGLVHIGGMSGRYLTNNKINFDEINNSINHIKIEKSNTQYNVRNHDEIKYKKILGTYFFGYLNFIIGNNTKPIVQSCNLEQLEQINSLESEINNIVHKIQYNETCNKIYKLVTN